MFNPEETQYEVLRRRGICRRDFLKFCSMAAVALGLGPMGHLEIAHAMETKPYLPVIWINGLSCSCCTESFIRSAHPLASDIILSMIALDYQDTIMAAAGDQAMQCFEEAISAYKGRYILAVEGNPPLGEEGMYCIDGGRPFMDKLQRGAAGAKAIVAWGTCASWGCVQAARPNPTQATPIHKVIHDKPIIKVPGCPAIPDVMSNIVAYVLTYDQLPKLDSQGRPEVFYGKRVHDQCVRRAHFDAGQFVESWDDAAASLGYCLYKMGCKGPTTYNACPVTRWNNGFPILYSPATAASAVPNRISGITVPSTTASPISHNSEPTRRRNCGRGRRRRHRCRRGDARGHQYRRAPQAPLRQGQRLFQGTKSAQAEKTDPTISHPLR